MALMQIDAAAKPPMVKQTRIGPDGRKYVVLIDPRTGQEVADPQAYRLVQNDFETQLRGLEGQNEESQGNSQDRAPTRPGTGQMGRRPDAGGNRDREGDMAQMQEIRERNAVTNPMQAAQYLDSTSMVGPAALAAKYGAPIAGALTGATGLMALGPIGGALGMVNTLGRGVAKRAFPEADLGDAMGTETNAEAVQALMDKGVPLGNSQSTLPAFEDSYYSQLSGAQRNAFAEAIEAGLSTDKALDRAFGTADEPAESTADKSFSDRVSDGVGGFFSGVGERIGDAVSGVRDFVSGVFEPDAPAMPTSSRSSSDSGDARDLDYSAAEEAGRTSGSLRDSIDDTLSDIASGGFMDGRSSSSRSNSGGRDSQRSGDGGRNSSSNGRDAPGRNDSAAGSTSARDAANRGGIW